MEQKIKNFDRAIEQMMNEQQVSPPFGMWNRISAELDASAMPLAASTPPAGALMPKRAVAGFIAGVLITGISVATGFMINSYLNSGKAAANTNITAPSFSPFTPANTANAATNNTAAKAVAQVPVTQNKTVLKSHTAKRAVIIPISSVRQLTGANVPAQMSSLQISTCITAVPLIKPAEDLNNNQYYFPPIDVVNSDKSSAAETSAAKPDESTKPNDDDGGHKLFGDKVRFHPRKRHKFSYGTIIRNR
ncbi:MAG TPA: hypothetical protein VG603_12660 [Chitinophagales bacterium]|nr:hypothetical protein [Chitinophagales bacterium]